MEQNKRQTINITSENGPAFETGGGFCDEADAYFFNSGGCALDIARLRAVELGRGGDRLEEGSDQQAAEVRESRNVC